MKKMMTLDEFKTKAKNNLKEVFKEYEKTLKEIENYKKGSCSCDRAECDRCWKIKTAENGGKTL
jgi:hypothetical protein